MSFGMICEDLLTHLSSEAELLEAQQEVLLRERTNLMNRKLEGILECVKEKETLQMQGRILRESRRLLSRRLAEALGSPEEAMTLRSVIEHSEEPMRTRLSQLKRRLEELVGQVERLTEGNGYLIRAALGQISKSITFLSQFQGSLAPVYDGEGRIMQNGPPSPTMEQQA